MADAKAGSVSDGWDGADRRYGRHRPMSMETIISIISVVAFLAIQAGTIIWYFRGQQAEIEAIESQSDWHQQRLTAIGATLDTLDSIVLRVTSAETQIAKAEQQLQVLHEIRTALEVTAVKLQNLADDVQDIKTQVVPESAPMSPRRGPR